MTIKEPLSSVAQRISFINEVSGYVESVLSDLLQKSGAKAFEWVNDRDDTTRLSFGVGGRIRENVSAEKREKSGIGYNLNAHGSCSVQLTDWERDEGGEW